MTHGLQHARLPCPLPSNGVYTNSCPLSRWCFPTISSSAAPFSFCLQSFPESGSYPMSRLFATSGQSIGASASTSVLPMNIRCWFPLGLTDLISLESKGLSRVFSSTTVQKHKFFSAQPSLWSNSHIHRWLLQKQELWPIRYKRLMLDLLKTCKLTLCLVSLNLEKCSTGVDADIMPWYVIWKCSPLPPAEWTQQRKIRV